MKEDESRTMRLVLFWTFLVMFGLAGFGTLAVVFLGYGTSDPAERRILLNIFIVQTATAVIALFYSLLGIKKSTQSAAAAPVESLVSKEALETLSAELASKTAECRQLQEEKARLVSELEQFRGLPDRIVGVLGAGEHLSVRQIVERLGDVDVPLVQTALGKLVQAKVIEVDGSWPAGYYRMAREK